MQTKQTNTRPYRKLVMIGKSIKCFKLKAIAALEHEQRFGEYKVTDDDIYVFKKLLEIWNEIIKIDVRSDIKLCQEYVRQLSKLNEGDKIIVSYHNINLEKLYSTTSNCSLRLCFYSNPDVQEELIDIQARCRVTQNDLNKYQLPQLLNIITKVQTCKTYDQYLKEKSPMVEERGI